MKQIKFLTNVSLEGKPVWFKDCIYQVMGETDDMYKLISEDLVARGIDKNLKDKMYTLIEIKEKTEKKLTVEEKKVDLKEMIYYP